MKREFGISTLQAMQQHSLEWRNNVLSTEPLLKPAAEEAVSKAYLSAGIQPPLRWIWVESPLAGAIASEALLKDYRNLGKEILTDRLLEFIREIVSTTPKDEVSDFVHRNYPRFRGESIPDLIAGQVNRGLYMLTHSGNLKLARTRFTYDWKGTFEKLSHQLTERELLNLPKVGSSIHTYPSRLVERLCAYGGLVMDTLAGSSFLHSQQTPLSKWQYLDNLRRHCGWWWPFEGICIMSERPKLIALDETGQRVHNEDGPALVFRDRWKIFARNGSLVSRRVISFKKHQDLRKIEYERNVESRRHMIEIYGYERYIRDVGASLLARDEYGLLFRKEFGFDEPLVLLRVENSTPEPDGSYKHYYLRVPPDMRTPRQAVAWTFNMDVNTYCPFVET